jgi:hypothetical protein
MDAYDWLRGRIDLFSPIGIVGMVGYHFFFIAPLLHVHLDYWIAGVVPPGDWRDWLGFMSMVNLAGLVAYRSVRDFLTARRQGTRESVWRPSMHLFAPVMAMSLVLSAATQAVVYHRFGGLAGFIGTFTQSTREMQGLGPLLVAGEAFPILAMFTLGIALGRRTRPVPWGLLMLVLCGVFLLQLLFGGLRGSRSNVVWAVFWASGIVHLWVRRLPRIVVPIGLTLLLGFMLVYSYYKGYGAAALDVLASEEARAQSRSYEGRPAAGVLLSDFGRADVQAYMLHQILERESDYDTAKGRTYLGTAALLFPRSIMGDRPPTKVKWGTDLLYGVGVYDPMFFQSSRIYGLAGEAILNFGLLAIPVVFALYGLAMGSVSRYFSALHCGDIRWLFLPFCTVCMIALLVHDSDVLLFLAVKNGLVPCAVTVLGSRVSWVGRQA